ncbi:hypothetical protein BDV93DRAFT_529863 [Ceratobasidium sp. AG-I]|nr:hypothetical protein BDV93DRAFT_529863 [Ceratobasidium sp. AG-I]
MDAPLVNRRVVQASGMRIHSHHHAAETTGTNYSNSASDVLFSLVPAVGSDIKGRRCMFAHRTWRTTISLKSYRSNVNAEETVWTSTRSRHIHSLAHNRALFSTLLAEVLDLAQLGDEGRTPQFRTPRWKQEIGSGAYGGWSRGWRAMMSFMEHGE